MKNQIGRKSLGKVILFILIISGMFLFLSYKGIIDISSLHNSEDTSTHFNLITVNSIFSGFLFSSLSLIVGLNETKTINNFEKAGFMDNIYINIISGIITSIISITLALIMLFFSKDISGLNIIYTWLIPSLELLTLIITILIFLKATVDIVRIIKSVRRNIKKKFDNDDISDILNEIK